MKRHPDRRKKVLEARLAALARRTIALEHLLAVRTAEETVRPEAVQLEDQLCEVPFRHDILAAVLLHNTPLAMVFFVVDGERIEVVDWNDSAERIFGWSKEEVLGRNFFEFLPHEEDRGKVVDICCHLKTNPGAHNLVNRCNSKSGKVRMIHWFNHSFTDPGTGQIYVVSLGHDITKEKQIERDLIQADKLIALGTLVSGVAHEINNPNNFIGLNANLLKEIWQSLNPVLEKYHRENGDFVVAGLPYSEMKAEIPNLLHGIEAGSRRIQKIVRQLREYSLPGPEIQEENLHLNEIVEQALALIAKKISSYTAHFAVLLGDDLPRITGSSQKLEQVVINLVMNACQSLQTLEKAVQVRTAWNPERRTVSLIVEDEGVGIAGSFLPQIMNPFFTTKRDTGGTGIGLSVCSRIVAEHRGRIDVKSELGAGSTFTVHLPISIVSKEIDNSL